MSLSGLPFSRSQPSQSARSRTPHCYRTVGSARVSLQCLVCARVSRICRVESAITIAGQCDNFNRDNTASHTPHTTSISRETKHEWGQPPAPRAYTAVTCMYSTPAARRPAPPAPARPRARKFRNGYGFRYVRLRNRSTLVTVRARCGAHARIGRVRPHRPWG